jgi:DNA-binding transcriptional MerR regulator
MARYRMKQVVELTGMSRQAIHFYIKKGLVPPPIKLSATSAEYTDEHIERILTVRRMREEKFLPLEAIRASLDERDEGFTPAQRRVISAVRSEFSNRKRPKGMRATVSVRTATQRTGASADDIEELIEAELIADHEDDGKRRVARDDLWLLEIWVALRELGFDEDHGFTPADVSLYERHVDALMREEVVMVAERLEELSPEELSRRIERALPLLGTLLGRLHERAVRRFFADLTSD